MNIYFRHDQKCFNFRVAGILKKGQQVLMSRINESYTLPGGRVRFGETTEQAIKREIIETLHVQVNVTKLLSINENFFSYGDDEYHEVLFVYQCEIGDEVEIKHSEIHDYVYVNMQDLVDINIKPEFLLHELKKLPKHITHHVCKD